ncbi:MAG: 1-phosphofructokinase family hexose kinase [Ignavibacteriae bacterium]|nr:1-phosphofructokinase family hexose kinase [Ignavibacteriota bacterium]
MITTVTLNPMLDKTVYVDRIQRGDVQRASKIEMAVGGKGVNVSRQLTKLGIENVATGFIGGEVGTLIERLLNEEHIAQDFIRVAGMTREGVTYREGDGTVTAVFEPPHRVTHQEAAQLVERVNALIPRSSWIVCSGSSPSPEADDVFAAIVKQATEQSVKTVVDSYGLVCRNAVPSKPTILKLNKDEYEQTFGKKLLEQRDYHNAFDELLGQGIFCCIVTDGSRAVYAATNTQRWKITPPSINAVNPTGSGDSMIAGMLYGYAHDWDQEDVLRFGVAAGACNAQRWEVANSSLENILAMQSHVSIDTLT